MIDNIQKTTQMSAVNPDLSPPMVTLGRSMGSTRHTACVMTQGPTPSVSPLWLSTDPSVLERGHTAACAPSWISGDGLSSCLSGAHRRGCARPASTLAVNGRRSWSPHGTVKPHAIVAARLGHLTMVEFGQQGRLIRNRLGQILLYVLCAILSPCQNFPSCHPNQPGLLPLRLFYVFVSDGTSSAAGVVKLSFPFKKFLSEFIRLSGLLRLFLGNGTAGVVVCDTPFLDSVPNYRAYFLQQLGVLCVCICMVRLGEASSSP